MAGGLKKRVQQNFGRKLARLAAHQAAKARDLIEGRLVLDEIGRRNLSTDGLRRRG